ncbi:MAG: 50S ribosomal protein L2 [Planctomycetes bacterium]|nr:50S ribosomal protein L2 [Planctomycetota bacterium]
MKLKKYNPTSAGRRHGSVIDFSELTKKRPEKSLTERIKKTGGRNNQGKITTRFRGGGAKKIYRKIDFKRRTDDSPADVIALEYDPNRSCHIALLQYPDGKKTYILAPLGLKVGQKVVSGDNAEFKVGNSMPLRAIPSGEMVHNIELQPGKGGQICRSAGTFATVANKEGGYAVITLPSGEMRKVRLECRATIGRVGNINHQLVVIGKAGRSRHMGRRPHNRGTSMNPVDHPMGGGEGRTGGGRHPCSPTGLLSKGKKTRQKAKSSSKLIIRGRKRGKR